MNAPSQQPDTDSSTIFPWDQWARQATKAGVSPEHAELGRAVMRESLQHDWCDVLKRECGHGDPDRAEGMVLMAKEHPFLTTSRWLWLLATDGLRFDPWEHREFPEDSPQWRGMRRRWEQQAPQPDEELLREAVWYLEDFYDLDQLDAVEIGPHAFSRPTDTLWADFIVFKSSRPDRVAHSGVIRIVQESSGLDAAVFERREEF